MVWYKDPLAYFHDENSPSHGFDCYFQDDGSRAIFYAPFSANTGFYYVRANDRTRNFFNSLLMSGVSHSIDVVFSDRAFLVSFLISVFPHLYTYDNSGSGDFCQEPPDCPGSTA